jgi:predicted GNAT family acetyltransferase
MKLRVFDSASAFYETTGDLLLAREAENSLMLGVVLRLVDGYRYGDEPAFLSCVEDESGIAAMATRTPPYNLLVWTADERLDGLTPVADHLHRAGAELPGVHGCADAAERFAALWTDRTGAVASVGMEQRLYRLTAVERPLAVPGEASWARPEDVEVLSRWARSFVDEAIPGDPAADVRALVVRATEARRLLVWDDGGPVSMAAATRPTPNASSISLVYTPPERRRRGYASGCVAELSQRLLDSGKAFCTLFTDLANPTSNAIYQRIGYRPVADFREIRFSSG